MAHGNTDSSGLASASASAVASVQHDHNNVKGTVQCRAVNEFCILML
mgnify:CR=1